MTAGGFGSSVASAAGSESAIGVVDFQVLVSRYPKLEQLNTELEKAKKDARTEFDEKSKNMNEDEKERYYRQLQERLQVKIQELDAMLKKDMEEAIKKVADKKGLKVVVDKATVIYGGTDITDEVAKSLQAAKK